MAAVLHGSARTTPCVRAELNAALYLASDEAGFITGAEFPVDGGRTI